MRVHGDYILCDELIPQQKSRGGIIIMASEEEDGTSLPRFGRVVSMGDGHWDLSGSRWIDPATRVKVGDVVLLSKVGDYRYVWNGKPRLITKATNVVGTLTEEEANELGFGG